MFYRDHPQDIRHRTVQSRKPPPMTTHLIRGDPDSATSPSKYRSDLPDVAQTAADGDQNYFSDLPADFAPIATNSASRPFRTLSTTESENEAADAKAKVFVQRKKSKKKRKDSEKSGDSGSISASAAAATASSNSAKTENSSTPAMVSFLTKRDKNVSHSQIEKFLHKSKMKYSVNEIRTAFENARSIGSDGQIELDGRQKIVDKWKMMVEALKKQMNDEEEVPGGTFSKSRPISISTSKPAESHTRLKLLNVARTMNKVDKLVPNTFAAEYPHDEDETPPSNGGGAKAAAKPPSPTKKSKTGAKSKTKKEDTAAVLHTVAKDTGNKTPLALATYKKGAKKPVLEHNPTEGFYRDFKFIYVILPEPVDELPCE